MKLRFILAAAVAGCFIAASSSFAISLNLTPGARYSQGDGVVNITAKDGKPIARYVYKNARIPVVEILDATGAVAARVIVAHSDVNGIDFWKDSAGSGKIVQDSISFPTSEPGFRSIAAKLDWMDFTSVKVLSEERSISVSECDLGVICSISSKFIAGEKKPAIFGSSPNGLLSVRLSNTFLTDPAKSSFVNSDGKTGTECFGAQAKWCSWSTSGAQPYAGVTIFDRYTNHGFPTYWQQEGADLIAAPFAGEYFTKESDKSTALRLEKGKVRTFVYNILIQNKELKKGDLDSIFTDALQADGRPEDVMDENTKAIKRDEK